MARVDVKASQEISLTRGLVAIVDVEDFEYLSQWKWFALTNKGSYYAALKCNASSPAHTHCEHRLLLIIPKNKECDHKDGDGLNNRRSNLRISTHQQNLCNQRNQRKPNSSPYKGVSWRKDIGKWAAYFNKNGRRTHLGVFIDEWEAALAYNAVAIEYYGDFAYPNRRQCERS